MYRDHPIINKKNVSAETSSHHHRSRLVAPEDLLQLDLARRV